LGKWKIRRVCKFNGPTIWKWRGGTHKSVSHSRWGKQIKKRGILFVCPNPGIGKLGFFLKGETLLWDQPCHLTMLGKIFVQKRRIFHFPIPGISNLAFPPIPGLGK
jgi:hypothetical protein